MRIPFYHRFHLRRNIYNDKRIYSENITREFENCILNAFMMKILGLRIHKARTTCVTIWHFLRWTSAYSVICNKLEIDIILCFISFNSTDMLSAYRSAFIAARHGMLQQMVRSISTNIDVLTSAERKAFPHIGNREIVGYGRGGVVTYFDDSDKPYPAVRFRESSEFSVALGIKEMGDWRNLSLEEKKQLYRHSFCCTFEEMRASRHDWRLIVGGVLTGLSVATLMFWYTQRCELFWQ